MDKEWFYKYRNDFSDREIRLLERSFCVLKKNCFLDYKELYNGRIMISPSINNFHGVWNWDSAFHALGTVYFDKELAYDQIEGFLEYINYEGMLPDVIWTDGKIGWHSSKPPVFPWAALEVYKIAKDKDFLLRIYDKLVLNETFWRKQRFDGKLFYYDTYMHGTAEEDLINAKYESGWDNSVRWDNGITNIYPVDLNCYMLMFYKSMYDISLIIGKDSSLWKNRKEELAALIEDVFWSDNISAYCDRDRFTGEATDILTPASFMPLFVQTASKERAKKMSKMAEDENRFNYMMPTVSYDNPEFSNDYWRGPLWLNTAYFAAKGLKNYNFNTGDRIRENILKMIDCVEDSIYENYDSINIKGLNAKDFSWSSCFIIEFILNW